MSDGPSVRTVMSAWDTFQVSHFWAASHSLSAPKVSCCGTTASLTTNWSQSRPFSHQAVSECASVHTYTQVDTAREEGRPWATVFLLKAVRWPQLYRQSISLPLPFLRKKRH